MHYIQECSATYSVPYTIRYWETYVEKWRGIDRIGGHTADRENMDRLERRALC